ncbi:MAG: hypothetical protein K0R71_1035 [Bacillales bacterium]|jgi:DegV family protein with EDD domain|nr:hypothetical protein [Bacillales bacterium]
MYTVVTDSSVYMTREESEGLNVRILPLSYSVNNQTFSEGYSDENGNYKELINSVRTSQTSQVSVDYFLSIFNLLIRKGQKVLCITISSRLSGTYANAVKAAQQLGSKDVMVIDSLSTAGGLRFLVEKACKLSKDNSLDVAAVEIEKMRNLVGVAFSVDEMDSLRKSGRLGFVRQSVSTILNLRPILLCQNGTVVSKGVVRGKNAQLAGLMKCIPDSAKKVIIHYINHTNKLDELEILIQNRFKFPVGKSLLGPVLGVHLGLSVIGVSWLTENE